ncbi:hypothetical protein ACFV4K_27515 [Nocardia sp. NPDC059764]|uniref:hypothetical protein n=1 Tax=Nocardia sp. NPDC059764 TaxID=3346939 RepID=UPI00365BD350
MAEARSTSDDADGSLPLTLSKNTTRAPGTNLFLNIANVKSSNQPPYGQPPVP